MAPPYMAISPLSVSVVCIVEHNVVEAGATAHYVTCLCWLSAESRSEV